MNSKTPLLLSALLLAAPLAPSVAAQKKGGAAPTRVPLVLPVRNLTADNAERARSVLDALVVSVFECPQCKAIQKTTAACPKCEVSPAPRRAPLLENIVIDPQTGEIAFAVSGLGPVHLSELTTHLGRVGVTIDTAKLAVAAPAVLIYRGGSSKQPGPVLETALQKEKLYAGAHSVVDETTGTVRVHVTTRGKAPLHSAIVAVSKDPALPKLTDVVWGGGENPKAAKAHPEDGKKKGKGKGQDGKGKKKGEGGKGKGEGKGGKSKGKRERR